MAISGGISRWTQRFSIGSALSMVGLQFAFLFDVSFRVVAIVGLFGAIEPYLKAPAPGVVDEAFAEADLD